MPESEVDPPMRTRSAVEDFSSTTVWTRSSCQMPLRSLAAQAERDQPWQVRWSTATRQWKYVMTVAHQLTTDLSTGPGCGTDRKNPNLNFGIPAPSPGIPVPTELPTILQISVTQPPTKAPTDVPTRSPTDPPSKLPSNGIPLDRPVQAPPPINTEGVETCGYTSNWDYAPGTDRHPIVPCTKHSDCAGFFDRDVVFDEYVPCCLYWRCICGSTFFETTSQAQHCALFECTTDVECPGGSCIQGVCDFSNVV